MAVINLNSPSFFFRTYSEFCGFILYGKNGWRTWRKKFEHVKKGRSNPKPRTVTKLRLFPKLSLDGNIFHFFRCSSMEFLLEKWQKNSKSKSTPLSLLEIFSRDFGKNSFKSLHNSKLLPNSNEKEFRMSFSFSCRKLSQNSNVYMNSSKL